MSNNQQEKSIAVCQASPQPTTKQSLVPRPQAVVGCGLHVYKMDAVCTAASFYSYFPMKRAISFIRSRTFTWNGQRGSHSPQPLQSEAQRLNDK